VNLKNRDIETLEEYRGFSQYFSMVSCQGIPDKEQLSFIRLSERIRALCW